MRGVSLPTEVMSAYSHLVDLLPRRARSWCQHKLTAHRVGAILVVTAGLFSSGIMIGRMDKHDPISQVSTPAAAVVIALVVYAAFFVTTITGSARWLAVAAVAVGTFATLAAGYSDVLIAPAMPAVAFVYSQSHERTKAMVATGEMTGVILIGALAFGGHAQTTLAFSEPVPWTMLAAAIGQAVRAKRAQQALLVERVRRAEETKESEARRRVQAERMRIARELHDAVGHHVALISVQSGAMNYLLDADPDKAREALAHIQQASEDALDELRLTVGLLRQPDEAEPLEPAGGLAKLDELTGSFTGGGLSVECSVRGQPRRLPQAVDLTAYRIIQESLTNVAKHAPGASAAVHVIYRPDALGLVIVNDGPQASDPADASGHGIIGMRERATAVGGWLVAAPAYPEGFRVTAELPAGTA
jgi:signal transduction histidine kinase